MSEDWRFRKLRLHFIYWVSILASGIVFLVSKKFGGNDDFVQYVSFASGLAGLLLAIVAIIYSFVTNESSSQNMHDLKAASGNISEISVVLKATADELEKKVSGIPAAMKEVTTSIGILETKVTAISGSNTLTMERPATVEATTEVFVDRFLARTSLNGIVALYAAKKSYDASSEFLLSLERTKTFLTAWYFYGFLVSVNATDLMTTEIHIDPKNVNSIKIRCKKINAHLESKIEGLYQTSKDKVKSVLGSNQDASLAFEEVTKVIEEFSGPGE